MKTARLITTLRCPRSCEYCCNKHPKILAQMKHVPLTGVDWSQYDEVILTGGEPTLDYVGLGAAIAHIRPMVQTLYLYSAWWTMSANDFLPLLDGITYTIHDYTGRGMDENERLGSVQRGIRLRKGDAKPFTSRLSLAPTIDRVLPVVPTAWDSIKIKRWRGQDEDVLSAHETLYLLE